MNTLIRHIEYLLSRNDCVVIPGFGALLANCVGATYDAENHTISHPIRQYTFTDNILTDESDMLITSICKVSGLSKEETSELLEAEIDCLKSHLSQNDTIKIKGVGYMSLNAGVINLIQSGEESVYGNTLWLTNLDLQPLVKTDGKIIDAPITKKPHHGIGYFGRIAASIAILLGIGFVTTTPIAIDEAMEASLAPDIHKVSVEQLVPSQDRPAELKITLPQPSEDSVIETETIADDSEIYCIIVATLATKAEAETYIKERPGRNLQLRNKGKYYSVYSGEYTDVREAYHASLEMQDLYPEAWVCKK